MLDRPVRYLACFVAVLLAGSCASLAGVIGLSWDPSAGAAGYRVYFADTAGNYFSNPLYDGQATSTTIDDNVLFDCTTWHFAVTAYNVIGESGFSENVASWPRPRVDGVSPASALQGSQLPLTISGGSFDPDTVIGIDNPNVLLQNTTVSCNEIQTLATVEPTVEGVAPALVGTVQITLTNPDGLSGTGPLLEVLVNPIRFDINQSVPTTDGRLDGLDTIWLATRFGSKAGDAFYDPDFDFDGDGWVDGNELAYIGSNFGLCWDGSAWRHEACP